MLRRMKRSLVEERKEIMDEFITTLNTAERCCHICPKCREVIINAGVHLAARYAEIVTG